MSDSLLPGTFSRKEEAQVKAHLAETMKPLSPMRFPVCACEPKCPLHVLAWEMAWLLVVPVEQWTEAHRKSLAWIQERLRAYAQTTSTSGVVASSAITEPGGRLL